MKETPQRRDTKTEDDKIPEIEMTLRRGKRRKENMMEKDRQRKENEQKARRIDYIDQTRREKALPGRGKITKSHNIEVF